MLKKEDWTEEDGDVRASRERGEVTTCYPSLVCQSRNNKRGGVFFDLSALKAAALVNLSVIIVNIINLFSIFIIKCGRFNDLGESVMCDQSGLLSL